MERHIILPLPGEPRYFLAKVGEGEEREKHPEWGGRACSLGSWAPGFTWRRGLGVESDTCLENDCVFLLAPGPPAVPWPPTLS